MEAGGALTAPDLLLSRRKDADRPRCGGEEEPVEDAGTGVLRGGATQTGGHSSKRLADVRKDVMQLEDKLVSLTARFEAVSPRNCNEGGGRERQTDSKSLGGGANFGSWVGQGKKYLPLRAKMDATMEDC